jgi:hypothetical protein
MSEDRVEVMDVNPPLMIFPAEAISHDAWERIKVAVREGTRPGSALVLDPGMEVYQLVEGRWQPVRPPAEAKAEHARTTWKDILDRGSISPPEIDRLMGLERRSTPPEES